MPLQDHMQLISTDDHFVEPADLWVDRLPARYRDVAPQLREADVDSRDTLDRPVTGSRQAWFYEGRAHTEIALNAVAGKSPEEFGMEPMRMDDVLPGCYDPVARIADMDRDGIGAAVCFPSFTRPAGTQFLRGKDKELSLLCVQAVNDYMIDEWAATAPDRFIPLAVLPLWDVDACVAEIERTAAKGVKTISFPENPVPLKLPSWHTGHWDPVFAAAEAAELPLSIHFGSSGKIPMPSPESPAPVWITLMGTSSMSTTADLIFSPVFHKFPGLKVALAEGGIGWMPWILERMDTVWERHKYYTGIDQDARPSDLFREHIYGCFISDAAGIAVRHEIGIDNLTWECDYPHSDSFWPESRARFAEVVADVPDADVHKISELNARALFNFPKAS